MLSGSELFTPESQEMLFTKRNPANTLVYVTLAYDLLRRLLCEVEGCTGFRRRCTTTSTKREANTDHPAVL